MSTIGRRKLLSLSAYEGAQERLQRHSNNDLWFVVVFGGFLLALASSMSVSRLLFGPDPEKWWAPMILPVFITIVGTPGVLMFVRRGLGLARRYPGLVCPHCDRTLDRVGIRMSGNCCSCGASVVSLPEPERASVQMDVAEYSQLVRSSQLDSIFTFLIPLSITIAVGGLAALLTTGGSMELIAIAAGAGLIRGIAWAYVRYKATASKIRCPDCPWMPHEGIALMWLIATGICPGCHRKRLTRRCSNGPKVKIPKAVVHLRSRKSFHVFGIWLLIALGVATLGMLSIPRQNQDLTLILMITSYGLFAIGIWKVIRLEQKETLTCPCCDKGRLENRITIATGCCTRCGASVLE